MGVRQFIRASADRADSISRTPSRIFRHSPVDAGFLHLYPVVVAIRESRGCREVHLELREVVR